MVTIIKNQLLKHLSRFTKNLTPEQISLSALRGSGELSDLTLEEDVLTDLLELPGWLRLTSAKCNKASFRIQWTKLKTVPILLNLDEVHIALEVCPEPRTMNPSSASAVPVPGKYSYIHKVIDGISVAVNQVQIDFSCEAFTSSVQISRMTVESRTPDGLKGDLRLTRIKSPDTGQLLIFKELEWQGARIEARPRAPVDASLPPLRLLLGNALCRIVIKKRMSDCAVLGSRLVLRPEAVAWALTDGQLRAAMSCAAALAEPVKKATEAAKRRKATRKVEEEPPPEPPSRPSSERDILARMFAKHDVRETSYHLLAPRIDLHLCDDPGLGRSTRPSLSGGGALQVSLVSMQADFFPYHRASSDRRHWRGYREAATPHTQWLTQALKQFCSSVLEALDSIPEAAKSTPQTPESMGNGVNHAASPTSSNTPTSHDSTRTRILQQLSRMMTTCLVLRIDDFTVYKVSTGKTRAEPPRPLVCGERAPLPGDAGLLHAELTFYYTPGDVVCPVPPPKLYAQLSPVRISVDPDSVVWLAAFLRHVAMAVLQPGAAGAGVPMYMEVRCEAIMPKIVLEAGPDHVSQQRDRPKELQICTARANITNVRESARAAGAGTRGDLASILSAYRRSAPPRRQFPTSDTDLDPVDEKFILHADKLDDIDRGREISATLLWREALSIWCCRVEPLWLDLCGARASPRPAPLLDATPLTAWICFKEDFSRINVLARTSGLCGLQINHYQLLFLLRQLEKLAEATSWLSADQARDKTSVESAIVVGVVVSAVELTLVLPSAGAGQESSRDLDSVPLDSSSLNCDCRLGSESTMANSNPERDSITALATQPGAQTFHHFTPPGQTPPITSQLNAQGFTQQTQFPPPSPVSMLNFTGLSSMRRGFSSLVTSIDGALSRDAVDDTASTASDDSDRYVVLGLAADVSTANTAFREFEEGVFSGNGVEMAAEVVEQSSTGSGHSRTSSFTRRRDIISTCTWRLNNVHIVHESADGKTCLRLVADDLNADECAAIPWDEFQNKFSLRARAFTEPIVSEEDEFTPRVPPKVAARLIRKELPGAGDETALSGVPPYEELLEARVRDLSLALNMSTALALAEFIEDEVIQAPMPLEVLMENLKIHLEEDRPMRSISSPPPQPLDIDLSTLRLTRDTSGIVHIGPPLSSPSTIASPATLQSNPELEEAREKIERLNKENEELKKRLNTLAKIAEDNRELRAKAEEASMLRACAHSAQEEAAALLRDKRQLLDALRALQEQLGYRGKR